MNALKNVNVKTWFVLALVLSLVNISYHCYTYIYAEDTHAKEAQELANSSTAKMVTQIDAMITTGEEVAHQSAKELEKVYNLAGFDFEEFAKNKTLELPNLLGVTVSYEPGIYPSETGLFSLYYDRDLGAAMRLDTLYNYTDDTLQNAKWYTKIAHTQKAQWVDPYYGSGAQNLVTDFSVPLFQNQKFIGVLTYTVSINNLIAIIHEISVEQNGLGLIIGNNGTIITHPNPEYVLKENIIKIVADSATIKHMLATESGFVDSFQSETRGELSLSYATLGNKQWKLINVFTHEDLFAHGQDDKRILINLFMAITWVVAMIILLIINREGINTSEAWTYSTFVTVALIANISFIWYLNLSDRYEPVSHELHQMKSLSDVNQYVDAQNSQRGLFGYPNLIEVPTGILIEKFDHEDTYNVGISGWIWQRYPLAANMEPGIHFPQLSPFAESAYSEIISQDTVGEELIVKWQFRSTFIFDFQYLKYPFNTKNVVLQVTYPDYDKGIIFTPDLVGYESVEPGNLPGILPKSATSSVNYVASVFSLTNARIRGDLGSEYLSEFDSNPTFQFEIKSRIPFLNALIKQIIPILLISLMMFLLLFSLRKKDGEVKSIGIETVAGLLFILVLSHIDFRQTIFSPEVTYLETFYFVIYIMMAAISISIVFVDLERENYLTRKNLSVIKLNYWPFFFFSVLLITLSIFY